MTTENSNVSSSQNSPWNSLEVTKIVVSTLTALMVLCFGSFLTFKQQERVTVKENITQVTKKRIELWDKIAEPFNDIYCYFMYVGNWKQLTPEDIIERKRILDKSIYPYLPFFSDDFIKSYEEFMNAAFSTYNGWGKDAKLRTSSLHRKEQNNAKYKDRFTSEDQRLEIKESYEKMLNILIKEFSIPRKMPLTLKP